MNKLIAITAPAVEAGAPLPTARLECVGSLGFVENKSKGRLGCRL